MKINKQKGLPGQAGNGTIVAIVIILIVLLAGAIYVWNSSRPTPPEPAANQQALEDQIPSDQSLANQEASLNQQGSSDELPVIEQDLTATSFSAI